MSVTRKQKWLVGLGLGALGCGAAAATYVVKSSEPRIEPDRGAAASCVADLALGGGHTCVLFRNGRVHCFGRAYSVGTGYTDAHPDREPVKTDVRFAELDAGYQDTCGVASSDGSIWCWGAAGHGGPRYSPLPARWAGLGTGNVSVGVAADRVCALRSGGEVWCQKYGEATASKVLEGAAGLSVDTHSACVIMKTGDLQCWGSNLTGELGRGTLSEANLGVWSEPPAPVKGLRDPVASLRSAGPSWCAITRAQAVWCWGSSDSAQFGDGRYWDGTTDPETSVRATPAPIQLPAPLRDFVVGGCLLATDRAVWCWGSADYNELLRKGSVSLRRDGSLVELEPTPQRLEPLGRDNERLFGGGAHYCVQKTDGSVWCWGNNRNRQVDRKLDADSAGLTRLPLECPPD